MRIGCGPVRLHHSRCNFLDELHSTRVYDDCVLLGSRDYLVPLTRCNRAWMLKSTGQPPCPPDGDCRLCSLLTARHTAAEQRLHAELAGPTRWVALKVLICAPQSARKWDAPRAWPSCTARRSGAQGVTIAV